MKKILLSFLYALVAVTSWAYDAEIDGIYYNFQPWAASVAVTSGDVKYSGEVVIPSFVTYNGTEYPVTIIGKFAFSFCQDLTSVTIPEGVQGIETSAFEYCEGLTSIVLPETMQAIFSGAFWGCTGLTSITIPKNVFEIGENAFEGCYLTELINNSKCTSSDNWGATICDVRQDDGLCIKDNMIFKYLGNDTSVAIPNTMTGIINRAFYGHRLLESIVIPESVTNIGNGAFKNCIGLKEIHCLATEAPKTWGEVFENVDLDSCTLYVPKGCKEKYASAPEWQDFKNIVEIKSEMEILQAEYDELLMEVDTLRMSNEELQQEVDTLRMSNEELQQEVDTLRMSNEELLQEVEMLRMSNEELLQEVEMLRSGDLNKDGRIDIEDVVLLISLENYSSDKDALTTLTDGSSTTVEEIAEKYGDVEYYPLDGKKVDAPSQSGIYIVKKDGQTKLIVVKK